ncbi:hypothetical protein [Bacillus sp. C30]|uniref:hypothetical protein n=1 Tax=Bacillus sp. C30 TaxID=1387733 RepID=UPI00349F23D7
MNNIGGCEMEKEQLAEMAVKLSLKAGLSPKAEDIMKICLSGSYIEKENNTKNQTA